MDEQRSESVTTQASIAALPGALTALALIEQRLIGGLATALTEEHTTVEQWRVLERVDALPAPTMGELSAASGLSNASLSRTVDALEDAAAVFRLVDKADRRRITVHMSDRGRSRLSTVRAIVAAWNADMHRTFGGDVIAQLADLAQTMTARLDAGGASE